MTWPNIEHSNETIITIELFLFFTHPESERPGIAIVAYHAMAAPVSVSVEPGIHKSSTGYTWCMSLCVATVVLILLVLVFSRQINYWLRATLITAAGAMRPEKPMPYQSSGGLLDEDDWDERLSQPVNAPGSGTSVLPAGQTSDTLLALGYTGTVPWDEVIQATELDPSTHANHMEFVGEVRRFSSGANFSDKADDNNSFAFTNFRGLRRPEHVEIGASARQQPDIDEDVLKRNKPFIFN
jgi:hypothetical protein